MIRKRSGKEEVLRREGRGEGVDKKKEEAEGRKKKVARRKKRKVLR
jgi:hypothetical protein